MGEMQGTEFKKSRASVQAFMESLDKLRDLVVDGSKKSLIPNSKKRTFENFDEIVEALDELTQSTPTAINSAMALVGSADTITSEAHSFAKKLKSDSEEAAKKLTSETKNNCDSAINAANTQAEQMRAAAKSEADSIIGNAKFEAERIIKMAQEQANMLVAQDTITLRAQEESTKILAEANRKVNEGYAQAQRQIDALVKENLTVIDRSYNELGEFINKELIAAQRMHGEFRKKVNYREN